MQPRQAKHRRPSFKTAHEFYRVGSYSVGPDSWLTDDERAQLIGQVLGELEQTVKRHFPRTQNLEYAVLKCHLIVEFAITQFIRCSTSVLVSEDEVRLPFSQKLEVAYLMGFGIHDPVVLPTIEIINRVRNQVAHRFTLDRTILDEAFRINSDSYEDFAITSDRERIRCLRSICIGVCGRIGGQLWAEHSMMSRER